MTYALWWGQPTGWTAPFQPGMDTFLKGLNGSPFLQTAAQYMVGGAASSSFGGDAYDTSAPPAKVSVTTLANEVAHELAIHAWGANVAVDPHGVYLVFTSNFPKGGGFCAWHSGATVDGVPVAVAYLPNVAGVPGCSDPAAPSTVDPGFAAQVNDTSHEFMESITDPQINAWYDQAGREIGDKCETTYGAAVTIGGQSFNLQEEWSNSTGGCVASS
ncbi:MAG TPA: hypothetical protein VGS61_06095 [Acidimicrobiales bacterium]|nr:hypothetical protein [Acidimicrobiales bacterium]